MTQVAEFTRFFPAWVTKEGLPMSWRHFVIGIRFLGRDANARTLEIAAGVRGGQASQNDYRDWRRELEMGT